MASPDRPPILVTGIPRSGTTWLARVLATAPGTAMPGREPMNPRGRQFALGGTLTGWARLTRPTPRQARILRRCFRGLEPRTFSRYGLRQWAAPWPGTRVVIKDPFAMLSIETVCRLTGALPVVVYRHPGAVLASYRRMGWSADVTEVVALGAPPPPRPGDLAAMATFWSFCQESAIAELARLGRGILVSHEELAGGGQDAVRALGRLCGLAVAAADPRAAGQASGTQRPTGLHDFARRPQDVATGWRGVLSRGETAEIERRTAQAWAATTRARTRLTTSQVGASVQEGP